MAVLRITGLLVLTLLLLSNAVLASSPDSTQIIPDTLQGISIPDHHAALDAAPLPPKKVAHWTSILPPLFAIGLSLMFRQVLVSLFAAIWLGVFLTGNFSFMGVFSSFFYSMNLYVMPAVTDEEHASIIIFSLMIGGMIGIIQANGGAQGIVDKLARFLKTRRDGQMAATAMGFIIFFDDYANTMIVGNTLRPLMDKLRITRAKLAYLVDSTSAPVATVALVSTWIGAMVTYIADAERAMPSYNEAPYLVFINSLFFNFYAWLTIIFVAIISWSRKDYGPMVQSRINLLKASVDPKFDLYGVFDQSKNKEISHKTSHWLNAGIPVAVLIFSTLAGLYITGEGNTIQEIVGSSNSYASLLWASMAAVAVAGVLTIGQRLDSMKDMLHGFSKGMFTVFETLMILVLAWALSGVSKELGTADFLVSVFNETLNPYWIPVLVFVLAGGIAFATGTSWGTMGILMPLVIPLIWNICNTQGIPFGIAHELIYGAVASVLAGAVLGDHCSPISDTTILSSLSSQCDHVEHVNTQMPYALTVGAFSIACLILHFVAGVPVWILYPVCAVTIWFVIEKFGRNPDEEPEFKALSDALILRDQQAESAR